MPRRGVVLGPDTKLVRMGGRPSSTIIILLALQLGLFLVYAFADGPKFVARHLALSTAQALGKLELWQPLTAPWLHLDLRYIIVNLITLWFFGPPLERWWGRRRFVVFYVVCGAAGAVLALFVGLLWPTVVVCGSAGAAMGLMVAFCILWPEHMVYFYGVIPLRAKWLGLLLAGFTLVGAALSLDWPQVCLQVGGALAALGFVLRPRKLIGQLRVKRAKRKFNVIDGGKNEGKGRYLN